MEYIQEEIWQRFEDYLETFHINKILIPKTPSVGKMVWTFLDSQ